MNRGLLGFPRGVGRWLRFTPTIIQTGEVTKTVVYARFARYGRIVVAQCIMNATGAGSGGAAPTISLPVPPDPTARGSLMPLGTFFWRDASASASFSGIALNATGSTVQGLFPGATNYMGAASPAADIASGDTLGYSVTYEAATD
jgi:hypothetical protein